MWECHLRRCECPIYWDVSLSQPSVLILSILEKSQHLHRCLLQLRVAISEPYIIVDLTFVSDALGMSQIVMEY